MDAIRLFALFSISLALFFSGCAQEQGGVQIPPPANPPSAPPANPPLPGPIINIINATPPIPQPPIQNSCSLSVPRRNLSLGDEIFIFVNATASPSDPVTLSCPEGQFPLGNGSMMKNVLCKFRTPGYFNLTATIGAARCAILPVSVGTPQQPAPQPKSCAIESVNQYTTGGGYSSKKYHFEAVINYSGYTGGSELTWNCDNSVGSIILPGVFDKPVSGKANIQCVFNYAVYNPTIPVMINGDSCGEISTR